MYRYERNVFRSIKCTYLMAEPAHCCEARSDMSIHLQRQHYTKTVRYHVETRTAQKSYIPAAGFGAGLTCSYGCTLLK